MEKSWLMIGVLTLSILSSLVIAAEERPHTTLIASLVLAGEHDSAGDTFEALIHVTNTGMNPAHEVHGMLFGNYPPTWIVDPADLKVDLGTIAPGETKSFSYTITRDETNATLLFQAKGVNTNMAGSSRVRVPIHPLVFVGIVGAMIGMVLYRRK